MKEFSKLFTQVAVMDTEGNQTGIDIVEVSTDDVIKAALGDTVLYEIDFSTLPLIWKREFTDMLDKHFVQVWPEGDNG